MQSDDQLERALELKERAQADPGRVCAEAEQLFQDAGDSESAAVACWAAGLGFRELGDLKRSESHLRSAIAMADRLSLQRRAAQIRDTLSFTLFLLGEHNEALQQAEIGRAHV